MGIFNADVIINIPPAFFSLQKSGLVRVYLTSVFLLLSVPRCFGDQKPQFDWRWLCYCVRPQREISKSDLCGLGTLFFHQVFLDEDQNR